MNWHEISTKFPCRESFIQTLYELIGDPNEMFPSAIFINGLAGTGKTSILNAILRQHQLDSTGVLSVYTNCVECYTSRILYENIIDELDSSSDFATNCDSLKDFVHGLTSVDCTTANKENANNSCSYILVLDNAERLRDMDANIMSAFMRLPELSGLNICVVFLSQLPLEKFYCKTGMSEIIVLDCPQYTKAETLRILSSDLAANKEILRIQITEKYKDQNDLQDVLKRELELVNAITSAFFNNYLNVFLSVFYKACRDVPELKITSRKCFAFYIKPVLDGSIDETDVTRLWRHVSGYLRNSLSQVYMRMDQAQEDNKIVHISESTSTKDLSMLKLAQSLELPYYAKYLLIASFLASHNSAKADKRLFVKNHGKQRKRMQNINQNAKTADKMSTSVGPKSFSIDRLLAIFYAILEEKVGLTCNLLSQISTLVHLKFLAFVAGEANIMDGSARLQCTVGLEFILNIGKVVGFNVRQYLCDFM